MLLIISSFFLSLTIVHLLYSGFISVAISKAFSAIAIEIFVKLFKVLICRGISHTIYFTHFLLGFAQHVLNVCASFGPHSSNYYSVVSFASTKAIPVLTFATFPTIICDSSVAFTFFCRRKKCSFLYSKVSPNRIINLLSALFPLRNNCNVGLLNIFGADLAF